MAFLSNFQDINNNFNKYTILVATSGDTGSAIASGFYDKSNINVVILYPLNKISKNARITNYNLW